MKSLLDIVNECDNARVRHPSPISSTFDQEHLTSWHLNPQPDSPIIGLLRPQVVKQLRDENALSLSRSQPPVWDFIDDDDKIRVSFHAWADTPDKRSRIMHEMCLRWRDSGLFSDVCGPKKWRGELYPVYKRPFGSHDHPSLSENAGDDLNFAFEMERAACALFGVVTYGVHMTIYSEIDGNIHVWIPTRAKTKPTWPGYLDNSVAGGIPSGMSVFESLVKETMEEASLPETIPRKYARSTGAVSYFFRTSAGWLQPEVEYVYDMRIPPDADASLFEPKPNDGEVESFEFLALEEVLLNMRQGRFKPNCALVIIDLLIRLGHITPDNEPDYMEINTRLHGRFDYESW